MKINTLQASQERNVVQPRRSKIAVATNPVRVKEALDQYGNVIDMRTKQIIRKNTD